MSHPGPTVLHLNLANQSSEVRTHDNLSPLVGGLGWALALFAEHLEEEPVVLAIGPLTGVFPGCSKTVAVFRSPQNGFLSISLGGGYLGQTLRFSGYQALVIKGAAKKPILINIDEKQVVFKDGSYLVNKEVPEVFASLFTSEGAPGRRSIVATGLAADKEISFAPLYVDEFFSFARGGLGAVFGQKNLKGFVVSGSRREELNDARRYGEVFSSIMTKLRGFDEFGSFGTLRNLIVEKKISGIPFENLNEPNFEDQHQLLEAFADSSRHSCSGCPVGCLHLAVHKGSYIPYDYESAISLGPLLGVTSKEEIIQLLAKGYYSGLDPNSLGMILAYLIEKEKLSFGNVDTYLTLIEALLVGKEDWARAVGGGLENAVKRIGGEEFALSLAGMEMLPYFNGYATVLSQLLSLAATTEENRGYLLDLEFLKREVEPKGVVAALVKEEKKKALVELLVGCGYLSPVFEETAVAFSALNTLGVGLSHDDLEEAAAVVFDHKLSLQKKLGFDPRGVKIPKKIYSVPSPQGILEEGVLAKMVETYHENYFQKAKVKEKL